MLCERRYAGKKCKPGGSCAYLGTSSFADWHAECSQLARRSGLPQPRDPIFRAIPGEPVVPYHTIAFSQQKLRAALRRAAGQDPAFNYGFVIHSRRQSERPTLGLITLHGESLAF